MNNDLDSFTVERLEEIRNSFLDRIQETAPSIEEVFALIDIALAAKRAEPVAYGTLQKEFCDEERSLFTDKDSASKYSESCYDLTPLYTTPQLNSPEIPEGWIKCSDQMPENDEFVRIWPLPDFGVELHVGQYIKFHKNGPGWFAQVYEHNYGVEFYPITVTHWMPLPAAPEKENG